MQSRNALIKLFSGAMLLCPTAAWAAEAGLVADTYVSSATPSLNFGNAPSLSVGGGNTALLQFDLSAIPNSASLKASALSATLHVFVNRVGTAGTLTTSLLAGTWTEAGVTYSNAPPEDSTADTHTQVNSAGEYVGIDVTGFVASWLGNIPNHGFQLSSTGQLFLDSKESTTTSHPATLDIILSFEPAGQQYVQESSNGSTAAGIFTSSVFGARNTVYGASAGGHSLNSSDDVAIGANALGSGGDWNTVVGSGAFQQNIFPAPFADTVVGYQAMGNSTGGNYNVALGFQALQSGSGSNNIAIGASAGSLLTGDNNIDMGNIGFPGDVGIMRIGTPGQHKEMLIAGIRGVGTNVGDAVNVVIDSSGQLGTINSSRRFKRDIADMGDASSALMSLRPVTFHYKQPSADGKQRLEYGLIAEEVADFFPDAVTYTPTGEAETIQYYKIDSMLLNEVQKQNREVQKQNLRIEDQLREIDALKERLAALERLLSGPGNQ